MIRIGFYAALPLVNIPSDLPNVNEFNEELKTLINNHHDTGIAKTVFEFTLIDKLNKSTF